MLDALAALHGGPMELAIFLFGLLCLTAVVLPFVLLSMVSRLRRREQELRTEVQLLSRRVLDLELRARTAERRAEAPGSADVPRAAPAPRPPPEVPLETVRAPPPPGAPRGATAPPPTAAGDHFLPTPALPPAPIIPPASPLPPSRSVTSPPPPQPQPAPAGPTAPAPAQPAAPTAHPRPPPPPGPGWAPPPPRTAPVRPPRPALLDQLRGFDWERIVGVKLFSILAGVVLAIAAIYAIILSIEAGIVTPPVRFAILTAVGAALVVGSELRLARAYAATALPLAAGGVVTLFGTFYAGYALWDLYPWNPPLVAFGLLAVVTAAAVMLSIRRSSLVIAVLGLLGGFATPLLVSTGEDRPLSLFGYLLLLDVALTWVSYRRRWTVLPWLALAFTALYQLGWVGRFLREDNLPLAMGIFLVFAVVGFAALRLGGTGAPGSATGDRARWSAVAGMPPAALALYLAAQPSLPVPWPLLLAFLALLAAGLAAVAAWQGPEWIHLAGAGLTGVTAAVCLGRDDTDRGWLLPAGLVVLALVYLAGPFLLARLGRAHRGRGWRPFRAEARLAMLVAPLFAIFASLDPALAARWPLVLVFLAVAALSLATAAAVHGPEWLHPAGAALTVIAVVAHLSAQFTEGDWPALAALTALLVGAYLAAPLLLARSGRELRAEGGHAALAAPLLLLAFVRAAPADTAASPLAFLAPLLALAACISAWAVLRAEGRVHALSSALAIVAAAVWSGHHLDAARLLPTLLAYLLLGALLLAAPLWAERRGRPLAAAATSPLLVGALLLVAFLARPIAGAVIGGLAGLTALAALLQAALFWHAARGRSVLWAIAGVAIGFLELGLWALTGLASAVLPLLAAVTVLVAVALAGALLLGLRPRPGAEEVPLRLAPFLALAGHAFVAVVAARADLALPPAPWLAVLGVLDLGFVAAALLRRRGEQALAAALATLAVLWAHLGGGLAGAPAAAWIACGAGLAAAALFLAGHLVARRTGAAPRAGLGAFGAAAVAALHGAQLFLLTQGAELPLGFVLGTHLALLAGLLVLAWISGAEILALSSAVLAGLAGLVLCVAGPGADGAGFGPFPALVVATAVWLVALAYPLLRGARARREWFPFLATAVASGVYLLAARKALLSLGAGPYLGALPVVEAALLVPHLRLLLRMESPSERDLRRLALVAASILGLVTVAVPLQLEKQWWTIGWALLAAALAWLWRRLPHRGLLVWAAALLGASFVRLVPVFNLWLFGYHPRSETPIWNWYLYTYLLVAGAHLLAAWWFSDGEDRPWPRGPRLCALAGVSGALLLFLLLNIEIADYWSPPGGRIVFRFSAGVGSDLSYTVGWAVFAILVLGAGVALRNRAVRIAAIALLAVTVVKGFLHDLGHLTGLYRVGSFVGLAVSLAVVAVVLQRYVLHRGDAAPPGAPGSQPPPPPRPSPPESTP